MCNFFCEFVLKYVIIFVSLLKYNYLTLFSSVCLNVLLFCACVTTVSVIVFICVPCACVRFACFLVHVHVLQTILYMYTYVV